MTKRVIPTSEGRLIEIEEGGLRSPHSVEEIKLHPLSNIPGMAEWMARRVSEITRNDKRGRKLGDTVGMKRSSARQRWTEARRKAREDMAKIKEKLVLSEAAEEALEGALVVMRSPQNQGIKLQAAKLVLDFTMAKPESKSKVTVQSAEDWLETLVND
jgi:hypothetical protein